MRFKLPDDQVINGRSYTDIVTMMHSAKFSRFANLSRYRKRTAQRAWSQYGVGIDPTNDRSFILSLEQANLLERVG